MKKILSFMLACVVTISLFGCGKNAGPVAASAEVNAGNDAVSYKYKNGDTIGQVIPFLYDDAGDFSNGLAPVKRNDKWGYIDKNGNEVIPFKYDSANNFSNGLGCVEINKKYGYIDKNGNEVIPFKYDSANSFSSNALACVKINKKYGYIDMNGKEAIPFKYDSANRFSNNIAKVEINKKYGYINNNGKEIIPIKYENNFNFSDGIAIVKFKDKYGCIDESGKEIIPIKYENSFYFSDGIASVKLNGKYGYAEKSGKIILPVKYDEIYRSRDCDNLYWLKSNDKFELFNINERKIISAKYDMYDDFSEGLACVAIYDNNGLKCGYINKNGEEVIPLKYRPGSYLGSFHDGLAPVMREEVYIDKNCNEVISGYSGYEFSEGLANVCIWGKGKFGYIDTNGNVVIPLKYDSAGKFYNGIALVGLNGKYGYIDRNGREITPFIYDSAYDFSDGFGRVNINDKYGYINKNGKEVIPIIYDTNEVSIGSNSENFNSNGLALIRLNDKYGCVDINGNVVVPIKYDKISDFQNGLAYVKLNNKYGYIDKTGNEVIPVKYDSASNFDKGQAHVSINGKKVYIDKNGKELINHSRSEVIREGLKSKYLNEKWGYTNENGNEVVPCVYDLVSYFSEGFAAVYLNGKWGYISYLPKYSSSKSNDYYYKDGNIVINTWADGHYYGDDGKMYRNRKTPDGKFVNTDGDIVDIEQDFKEIDKNEVEGNAWFKTKNGIWYYFEGDRTNLKKGWFTDPHDEQTYYLDPETGIMQTGWQKIDGKKYYFNESHDNEPNWYYVAENDIYESYGKKVKAYGSMYKNEETPDGKKVDKDGKLVK